MKIKVELTPEKWGLVTSAIKYASGLKGGPWKKLEKEIIEQLEFRFEELEKQEHQEGQHPDGECTSCYCEKCKRMCMWIDLDVGNYCLHDGKMSEEAVLKGCCEFENAW